MRIVVTSDLVYSEGNDAEFTRLAADIENENPDLFLIAGNIGSSLKNFTEALQFFDQINCPKAIITGNRDLWQDEESGLDTQTLWDKSLPEVIEQQGFIWLEKDNLTINSIGICGTMGWYDYSARGVELGYSLEQYEELKGLVNEDARRINWLETDRDFAKNLQEDFAARIESLDKSRDIDHLLVITHFPLFKEMADYSEANIQERFKAAYEMNLTMGRVVAPRDKVRYVVSGHLATPYSNEITFGNNTFTTYVIGYEADKPRYLSLTIK